MINKVKSFEFISIYIYFYKHHFFTEFLYAYGKMPNEKKKLSKSHIVSHNLLKINKNKLRKNDVNVCISNCKQFIESAKF